VLSKPILFTTFLQTAIFCNILLGKEYIWKSPDAQVNITGEIFKQQFFSERLGVLSEY
jgi:uncharacterized membrane protein